MAKFLKNIWEKLNKMTEDSTNKEIEEPIAETAENQLNENEPNQEEIPAIEPSELEILTAKNIELNDKFLRLYSDFENFRKQKAKERIDLIQSAGADVVKSLITVLDDFDRAIASNDKVDDIEALREGFKLIHQKLKSTLEKQGLKEMEATHTPFDTDLHEALTNIPAPTEDLVGKVVEVAEKGYFLNDKVIRFAKVIVGQ